jgi:hypothetical protein
MGRPVPRRKHAATAAWGTQLTMDTSYATPGGFSAWQAVPDAGSPLIGDATGVVPYDDFYGSLRGPAPDRGAVEA